METKESYKDRQENELEVLKVNNFLKFRLEFRHIFLQFSNLLQWEFTEYLH